jgi:NAD(P)-dependent dehydrogenase (short-subunit alcohol dehydrogenase family)
MLFSGKNCLITGANSGLGFAVARRLARSGAHTILLCRIRERGNQAVRTIEQETPNASVDLMICDLASLESIEAFIRDFRAKYSELDILLNNAAVMKRKRTVTADGFEMMFQVNYLAPFMLMNAFLDLLKKSSLHQIVNIALPADDLRLNFDDLQFEENYHIFNSFFQTKLYLLLASLELSRRDESDELRVTLAVPGSFRSNLARDFFGLGWVKNLFVASVDSAAENILFVINLDEEEKNSPRLFEKREEKSLVPYWENASVRERLWSTTEALLEKQLIRTKPFPCQGSAWNKVPKVYG